MYMQTQKDDGTSAILMKFDKKKRKEQFGLLKKEQYNK